MSTFMANPQNVERKWYVIDAAGKPSEELLQLHQSSTERTSPPTPPR